MADPAAAMRELARPLESPADLDPLVDRIGECRVVLLGEASHGTSEFYRWRDEITRRLVTRHGFRFVAVEGDWPDCDDIDRWLKGRTPTAGAADTAGAATAREVLRGFERWPTWMWANDEVADLLAWLRDHNDGRARAERVGFHGLDVYSLWDSLRALVSYLVDEHPEALPAGLQAMRCFEPYGEDPQEYAWATRMTPESCEDEVVRLLSDLRRDASLPPPTDTADPDDRFSAEQNALVVEGAERYYRTMVRGGGDSWNVRDIHMADTLDRLLEHYGPSSRGVVWAHNTHVGDARFTDMASAGMVNLGQLARERHGDDVAVVGFTGHRGTVVAAPAWGDPSEVMPVPEARTSSFEHRLREAGIEDALLVWPAAEAHPWLAGVHDQRAIGVVYRPEQERRGNYVPTVMGRRYDALLAFGHTDALHPIAPVAVAVGEPETWPTGQ